MGSVRDFVTQQVPPGGMCELSRSYIAAADCKTGSFHVWRNRFRLVAGWLLSTCGCIPREPSGYSSGWSLVSVEENLDTRTAMGEFVTTIMASLAQMERKLIGERIGPMGDAASTEKDHQIIRLCD